MLFVASRTTGALGAGISILGRDISGALPKAAAQSSLVLPDIAPSNGGAGPIFDDLPSVVSKPALLVVGRVPSFAMQPGRQVKMSLNGEPLGAFAYDQTGRFGSDVTLRDGSNVLIAGLVSEKGDVIASTNATIVLDRSAPPLTVTRPRSGETFEGEVAVQGRSAARIGIRVNDRIVAANPDGSFTFTFTAPAGPLNVVVVARNEAGVETTTRIPVVVAGPPVAPADVQVGVALDRLTAKLGESVTATLVVTTLSGRPVPNAGVSLSIGLAAGGLGTTDANGRASIAFEAPQVEGDVAIIGLSSAATGRAVLHVVK